MRFFITMSSVMMLAASMASAQDVTFTTSTDPSSVSLLKAGDTLTIDITVRSASDITAISAGVTGFGSVLSFDASASVGCASILNQVSTGPCQGFGGFSNTAVDFVETTNSVAFLGGLLLPGGPPTGSGELDISPVDGTVGGPQFRLVFTAEAAGFIELTVGSLAEFGTGVVLGDGLTIGTVQNSFIFYVPEPGTALLIGLGLAGLCRTGRES